MSNNFLLILLCLVCVSCGDSASDGIKEKDHPGYEYMPDMYHSFAYDAYSVNPNFSDSMTARKPVQGTIARGFMPFEYENTLEDFNRAAEELINPLESNNKNLRDGESLYGIFCAHCHGKNGDGKGSITHPVYSAVPSYADDIAVRPRSKTTMKNLKDGHIYHTIFHGYNAMGPHYNLVSDEERWKIVLYVNQLKNVEK
tara:strand:+ start:1634 stop:2230 length:597 start_codon:yes stop_codon:yes gene_type:complete